MPIYADVGLRQQLRLRKLQQPSSLCLDQTYIL